MRPKRSGFRRARAPRLRGFRARRRVSLARRRLGADGRACRASWIQSKGLRPTGPCAVASSAGLAASSGWSEHPETKPSLERWLNIAKSASWSSMNEIQSSFRTAKVLNADRVRFEVHGGNYRLVVALRFQPPDCVHQIHRRTHKQYEPSDPLTVSLF